MISHSRLGAGSLLLAWMLCLATGSLPGSDGGGSSSDHWAFQPIHRPQVPLGGEPGWENSPIDAFVAEELERAGMELSPRADRRTLLRRATFGLTGLPPTPREVDAFLADETPDAFERVIERLLGSERYGEHWGRWWLDVARYADTNGQDENKVMANAWRYRDWVVRAFNTGKPFDQFIVEQLAGDLLPDDGIPEQARHDRWIATAFLVLGPKMLAEQDKVKLQMDIADEQIDTMGRAFLGLTLGCARCHDHKFDPVPARDYYALAGIFRSTRTMENLDFVSKFNERGVATRDELAAIEAHKDASAANEKEIKAVVQSAEAELVAGWEERFGDHLTAALSSSATGSAEAGQRMLSELILRRLRDRMGMDPATNLVSRTLRRWASQPGQASVFLEELKGRRQKPAPPAGAGKVASGDLNELTEEERRAMERAEMEEALFGAGGVFSVPGEARELYPAERREQLALLERQREQLKASTPSPPAMALAVADDTPVNLPVHLRGSHLNLASGSEPRGVLRTIRFDGGVSAVPAGRSGRLTLARWITHPGNPLTARVAVNRIWQGHFGRGLVSTPDNFGLKGAPPTHPKLLDWLADEFQRSGWDVKGLHRLILRSAVYQQAGRATAAGIDPGNDRRARALALDPDNRLLGRFPRQRLTAEMIRDSLLFLAGRLDPTVGGSLIDWTNNEYARGDTVSAASTRRTLYLPIVRDRVYDALTIFDFANPSVCTARRTPTVVAHQALFFLNSPLVADCSAALAAQLMARTDLDEEGRLQELYRVVLNRPGSSGEIARLRRFLAGFPGLQGDGDRSREALTALCQVLFASNEFVYRY